MTRRFAAFHGGEEPALQPIGAMRHRTCRPLHCTLEIERLRTRSQPVGKRGEGSAKASQGVSRFLIERCSRKTRLESSGMGELLIGGAELLEQRCDLRARSAYTTTAARPRARPTPSAVGHRCHLREIRELARAGHVRDGRKDLALHDRPQKDVRRQAQHALARARRRAGVS